MDYILNLIYYPLAMVLKLCYMLLRDYGWSIILFAIIAKALMLPIGIKSEKSRRKLQAFQPRIKNLQAKYKGDTKNPKYNEELQKLYSEEGYNPMSGCLPLFIQLPLIMGLWNAIRRPLTYIFDVSNTFLEKILLVAQEQGLMDAAITFEQVKTNQIGLLNAINELNQSSPALISEFLPAGYPEYVNMTFLGLNLGDKPTWALNWVLLIPIISALTSFLVGFITQKINKRVDANGEAQGPQSPNFLLYTMPIISLLMAFSFENGIGIYWIASNLLSIAQTFVIAALIKEPVQEVKVKEKKLNYNQIAKLEREGKLSENSGDSGENNTADPENK